MQSAQSSAQAAPAQADARELRDRARALAAELASARDAAESEAAGDELAALCDELVALHEAAGGERGGRGYLPALYHAFSARGEHERGAAPEEREAWLERAHAFAASWGDEEAIVRARLLLGTLWIESGRPGDAAELARGLLDEHPTAKLRPFVLFQLATALDALGDATGALDRLDELEASAPDEPWAAALRCQVPALRAQVYFGLGVVDLAVASARAGRACLDALGAVGRNHAILMDVQELNVELAGGRFDPALERVGRALADQALYPARSAWRGSLLGGAAQALVELERRGRAGEAEVERALSAAAECELVERDRCKLELVVAERALERGELERAADALRSARARLAAWRELAGAGGPLREELSVAAGEAALALARGDGAELADARVRLERALDERLATFGALAPLRRGGTGFLEDAGLRGALIELARASARLDGERAGAERALASWMRVQSQGSLSRAAEADASGGDVSGGDVSGGGASGGVASGGVAAVRAELLAPRRGALVFLPGAARSLVLALGRDEAFVVELAREAELARLRAELLAARAGGDTAGETDAARAAGARLAGALFPARVADALLRWEDGVTLVGLDLVGDPPVGALPIGAPPLAGGEPLGTLRALDVLPSLPLGLALARRARPIPAWRARLVLLAAPMHAPEIAERFPGVAELAWEGSDLLRRPLTSLTGRARGAATLDSLVEALPGASELAFLTHCVRDARLERPAALVLAPGALGGDGLLTCDEIEERGLAAPLVLVAACGAALGPERGGDEGAGHLGGAFLRAGARVVLLSGEDLELGAAQRVSVRVRERLHAGDSPAEALRAALAREDAGGVPLRGALLAAFGLGHVPLYDAPLALPTGLAGPAAAPPTTAARRDARLALAAGALALLAAALAWLARRARRAA